MKVSKLVNDNCEPLLIPNLKSITKVEYKTYDVEITNIKIKTLKEKEVNLLVMNEIYYYCYDVHFKIDATDVSFAMKIKSETGLYISGINSFKMKGVIDQVQRGDIYSIKWKFKCILTPGMYYTNAGVTGNINQKLFVLNRITDALAFKVQQEEDLGYVDLVHLFQVPVIEKIS